MRRSINIRFGAGRTEQVAWYGPISENRLRSLVASCANEKVVVGKIGEDYVAINDSLPDDITLDVFGVKPSKEKFHGQLLRLENMQAHLANERTWLAWVRTSLASMSIAYALVGDSFVVGCGFVVAVLTLFTTGWLRFTRVREVLHHPKGQLAFQRFGLSSQAYLVGFLCLSASILYLVRWFH